MFQPIPIQFFLGANSPQGFVSLFDELSFHNPDWHTFIIKGGPGCGKSSLMRKIAADFRDRSPSMQMITCSSDPDSLDAVILPEYHVSIADGTAPHTLEPKYPALNDILVPLGNFLSPQKLTTHSDEIYSLDRNIHSNYSRAIDCFFSAKRFLDDSVRLALGNLNLDKIAAYAEHFAGKHFPRRTSSHKTATEQKRLLSSLNAKGITFLSQTVPMLCPDIYFIEDESSAAAPILLSHLRELALKNGYSIISCYCPLSPQHKLEHLLIPEIGLAILTENRFHDLSSLTPLRRIHAKRFENSDTISLHKKQLSFDRKAAGEMITSGCNLLAENKALHDRMEHIYLTAMDFSKMKQVENKIIEQILALQ